ncbi:hypothetical protein NPIL_440221 [Nephila pilipes]|uniref:Uncharacterized protein n=1 Tax=Nephila pilipes TaxID=299642 RepID=A0A8X6UKM7_NEPPI|nr:hypothetical protein NPIL_440221 [Nephila pilipes]
MFDFWASNQRWRCTLCTNSWIHFRTRTPLGTDELSCSMHANMFKTGDFLKLYAKRSFTYGTKAYPMFNALAKLEPNEKFSAFKMLHTASGGTSRILLVMIG